MNKNFVVIHQICGEKDVDVIGPPMTEDEAVEMAVKLQDMVDGLGYEEKFWEMQFSTYEETVDEMRDCS